MVEARYYARIGIVGREEPFVFDIEKDEWDRLHRYLGGVDQHDFQELAFLEFADVAGHTVIVSLRDMAYMNLLFEHGDYPFPTIPADDDKLHIYFRGQAEPYISSDIIEGEMWDIAFSSQTSPEISPFLPFTDEDGEVMYVNLHQIQLLELPTRAVEEGMKQELDELEEFEPVQAVVDVDEEEETDSAADDVPHKAGPTKKVRVTVVSEFSIPESWMHITREEDGGHCFLIDGKLYQPSLGWWRLEERAEDGTETWTEASDEIVEMCPDSMGSNSETIEEIDAFMYEVDEDNESEA